MRICIYGASGNELAKLHFDTAERLGGLIASGGHSLVFGGGAGGLMGACARAALEAGGEVIGVAPRFFDEPGILLSGCTAFHFTKTMSERKSLMAELSDAFLALPGGIGTWEEFLETLTQKQLGLHAKPMVLLNTLDYYGPLLSMFERAAEGRFLSRRCFSLFSLCSEPEEAIDCLLNAHPVSGDVFRLSDYSR